MAPQGNRWRGRKLQAAAVYLVVNTEESGAGLTVPKQPLTCYLQKVKMIRILLLFIKDGSGYCFDFRFFQGSDSWFRRAFGPYTFLIPRSSSVDKLKIQSCLEGHKPPP